MDPGATLLDRMAVEHPHMPASEMRKLFQDTAVLDAAREGGATAQRIAAAMRKAGGESAASWLLQEDMATQASILSKCRVIATTRKMLDLIPENVRKQVQAMITAQATQKQSASVGAKPQPQGTPSPGVDNAMDMINKLMGSGVMEQMQEMATNEAEDIEDLKDRVTSMERELAATKQVVNALVTKINLRDKLQEKQKTRKKKTTKPPSK